MASNTILPPSIGTDPSMTLIVCEICGATMTLGDSHSFIITYGTTGPAHVSGNKPSAFQCPSLQHFTCSADHARVAAHACIDEHLLPLHASAMASIDRTYQEAIDRGIIANANH